MIKYLRRTTRGTADSGLDATIRNLRRTPSDAAGNDLGTTIEYLRGAAGIGLGTTIKYLRSAAGWPGHQRPSKCGKQRSNGLGNTIKCL
jgi:hypothetical protein